MRFSFDVGSFFPLESQHSFARPRRRAREFKNRRGFGKARCGNREGRGIGERAFAACLFDLRLMAAPMLLTMLP